MPERVDAIVVGGGAMGTAAALELARRGRDTTLLERFGIGHANGSSHGATRIFRLTYEHPTYVRMATLALDAWRELEDASGERLVAITGGLDVGDPSRVSADALDAAGTPYAWIEAEEAMERWPGLRFAPGTPILLQDDGGVCFAARTVAAQARLAQQAGVAIRERTTVEAIEPRADGVLVSTADATMRAGVCVVAAGGWAAPLLATAGIRAPLVPSLEQVSYHRLLEPSPLPTLIDWTVHPVRTPYSVPNPEAPGSFKIGLHRSGPDVDARDRSFAIDSDRLAKAEEYVADRYAPAEPDAPPETCLYTNTPDEDFVLDRVGALVIGSPCSGHGFKFVPLIGGILADLATGAPPPIDLAPFRLDRGFARPLLESTSHLGDG
jgi:sarcosine oxidase